MLFRSDEAEEEMLAVTCARATLTDGQRILELGCGWGSLSLWMAEHYPSAQITAVSNSRTQKEHIDAEAARRGFGNLTIVTADMNVFDASETFDRVGSCRWKCSSISKTTSCSWRTSRAGWCRAAGCSFTSLPIASMPITTKTKAPVTG